MHCKATSFFFFAVVMDGRLTLLSWKENLLCS